MQLPFQKFNLHYHSTVRGQSGTGGDKFIGRARSVVSSDTLPDRRSRRSQHSTSALGRVVHNGAG